MKKRKLSELTKWEDFEKELWKDRKFREAVKQVEHEYTLAKSIIELRKKRNLSQSELAKRAKTKQPVISRIERAVVKPSLSLLQRIAKALDASLEIRLRAEKRCEFAYIFFI